MSMAIFNSYVKLPKEIARRVFRVQLRYTWLDSMVYDTQRTRTIGNGGLKTIL